MSQSSVKDKVPYHYKPQHISIEEWQIRLRRQFALEQHFLVTNLGSHPVYSDFEISNPKSGKQYKVALRPPESGRNYCSCPDFAINTLGTCKHIEYAMHYLKQRVDPEQFNQPYLPSYSSVFVNYGLERQVVLRIGTHQKEAMRELSDGVFGPDGVLPRGNFVLLHDFFQRATELDPEFRCYEDVFEFMAELLDKEDRIRRIQEAYPDDIHSFALNDVLKANLFTYQKEGILFAARAGRSLIADEMGLGKTIQAIGAAEIMANLFGVESILIICPTSLKYQWKSEIEKFTYQTALVAEGNHLKRSAIYRQPVRYKITSYHTIHSDLEKINQAGFDLVILDEAQKIKNWKTQTAQRVKKIKTPYTIVLTGTPMENRIDELHSIVSFIDPYKLGPMFRFLAAHELRDPESNKVVGYQDLSGIHAALSDIIVRRTKSQVQLQLPERLDKTYFVPMTNEQMAIHEDSKKSMTRLIQKWKRFRFLSEQDRLLLLKLLGMMRMVCCSTYILDEKERHDTKIDELVSLLTDAFENGHQKVVIFCQWERMTRLVANELENRNIGFQYLHGGVPSKDRKELLTQFHEDPDCRIFLSTDAGGVGLNLQCASMVINLDVPWNPAILEQRIARAHRMGQKNTVYVVNFVAKNTIEEQILGLLKFKSSVFSGALDNGQDMVMMGESKMKEMMDTIEKITITEPVDPDIESDPDNQLNSTLEQASAFAAEAQNESCDLQNMAEDSESEVEQGQSPSDEQMDSSKTTATGVSPDTVQQLFQAGMSFLQSMSNMAATTPGKTIPSLIAEDKETGEKFIKVPIVNDAMLQNVTTALNALAAAFTGRK